MTRPLWRNVSEPDAPNRSCALVGSGGSLLYASYGEEIDSHEVVMRFNDAPTIGFEAIVGNKTTHRLVSTGAHRVLLEKCRAQFSAWSLWKPWKGSWSDRQRQHELRRSIGVALRNENLQRSECPSLKPVEDPPSCCPKEQLLLSSYSHGAADCFSKICPNSFRVNDIAGERALNFSKDVENATRIITNFSKGSQFMSGMNGLIAAAHMCKTIDMYGFDLNEGSTSSTAAQRVEYGYHYYDGCARDASRDVSPAVYAMQIRLIRKYLPQVKIRFPTSRTPLFPAPEASLCPTDNGSVVRVCGHRCPPYHRSRWKFGRSKSFAWTSQHIVAVTLAAAAIFIGFIAVLIAAATVIGSMIGVEVTINEQDVGLVEEEKEEQHIVPS